MTLDEPLEDTPTGDRRRMPGGEESLDARLRHLGDDFHHRRDVFVRGEHEEVRRRVAEHGGGCGDSGGLEPGGEEHQRLVDAAREIHRLRHAVDHVDGGPFGLHVGERPFRAGDLQHVAVGRDAHTLPGERDAFVDLGHVGDAHRTSRPHDHVERARQRGAQPEARDRLLVAAAHVHDRDGRAADGGHRAGERLRQGARARGIAELELGEASRGDS